MRRPVRLVAVALAAALWLTAGAGVRAQATASQVTAVDKVNNVVTAREMKSGRTFAFVLDASEVAQVRLGEAVEADVTGGRLVSVGSRAKLAPLLEPTFKPNASISAVLMNAKSLAGLLSNIQPVLGNNPMLNPERMGAAAALGQALMGAQDPVTGTTVAAWVNNVAAAGALTLGQDAQVDRAGGWVYVQFITGTGANADKRLTYSFRVHGAAALVAAPTTTPGDQPTGGDTPAAPGQVAPYALIANPALRPNVGRVVINFPEGADVRTTRIELRQVVDGLEQVIKSDAGKMSITQPPGTYQVSVSGARVTDVPVRGGQDTTIRVGVLRIRTFGNRRVELSDVATGARIANFIGSRDLGLPVGRFGITIAGKTDLVTIKEGKITVK